MMRCRLPTGRKLKRVWSTAGVLCSVALLGNLVVQHALADGPAPLAEYVGIVARAEQLAGDAAAQPDLTLRQTLCGEAADALDGIGSITLDSGESMTVDNQELIARLRQREPTQASARGVQMRLNTLRDGLGVQAGSLDPADREKLLVLLAQPPFIQPVADDSVTRLIDDLLARLFGGAARGVFNMGPVIVVVGILLAAGVVVYFAVALRRTGTSEATVPLTDASGEQVPTANQAFNGAERYIAAGDIRSAVRLLYLGTLLRLEERGLLRFDRSLTNREHLRSVAGTPSIQDALRPIVETFDRTWYGFAPLSAGEFAQYQAQVDAIRNAHLA